MSTRMIGWIFCLAASLCWAADPATKEKGVLLFDFEEETEGWKVDWAEQDPPPQISGAHAHHGKNALVYVHRFKADQQSVGGVVTFQTPKDFSSFKKLTAWVYLPEHSDWQAQMYARSGENWTLSWGDLYKGLQGGWHKVELNVSAIENASAVKDIGVQIKNWTLEGEAALHIDEVTAVEP